jgi:hypothetical protein
VPSLPELASAGSSLADTQRAFADAVIAAKSAPLDQLADGHLPAGRLMQIYRNNFYISLSEALRDCHPVTAELLGADFFAQIAREYVRENPSNSGNLHDFGTDFADHLGRIESLREHPYVADVARLEWHWHRAFHAADATPIDQQALAAVTPDQYPQLRFALHPSAALLRSPHPIASIWQAHQPDGNLDAVDLWAGGESLLVIRPQLEVLIVQLSDADFAFLSALADGQMLESALAAAFEEDNDWPFQATFGHYLANGTLCELRGS